MIILPKILKQKSQGKEEKVMKKLFAIVLVALFALNTSVPAMAFTSDVIEILSAEADLETGVPDLRTMSTPELYDALTDAPVAGSKVSWSFESGKIWKRANEYVKIAYGANLAGWGIQLYSDNTGVDQTSPVVSPVWTETPDNPSKPDSPAGLVGEGSINYLSIPIAWKAFPGGSYGAPAYVASTDASTEYRTSYTEPTETAATKNAAGVYVVRLYQYKSGSDLYGEYSWLVDKGTENWFDDNLDDLVDPGEIRTAYADGDDGNTVVNYLGSSTSTYDTTGTYIFRDTCESPIYLALAAKIAAGTIKGIYSSNTLTLELYHE